MNFYSKLTATIFLSFIAVIGFKVETTNAQIASATSTCYSFTRDLAQGMRDDDVARLQTFLIMKGHDIEAISTGRVYAGFFGSSTKSALIEFQGNIGVSANGYFGSSTRAVINNLPCDGSRTQTMDVITTPVSTTTSTTTSASAPVAPHSNECYVFTRDLSLGSRGQDVIELNSFLSLKGYDIPGFMKFLLPKNYLGPGTMSALNRYKEDFSIKEEGFGPVTRDIASRSCVVEPVNEDRVVSEQPPVILNLATTTLRSTTSDVLFNEDEITLTGVKTSFETINDDTAYSPTKATVLYNFTLNNGSGLDIYIGRNPRTSLVVSTEGEPAYHSFSFFDASGPGEIKDTPSAFVIEDGSSRAFSLTGFVDNAKGTEGNKTIAITAIPYSLSPDLSPLSTLAPEGIHSLKTTMYLRSRPLGVSLYSSVTPATSTIVTRVSTTTQATTSDQVITENPLTALCYGTPPNPRVGDMVYWNVSRFGGQAPITYSWAGTDGLYGKGAPLLKVYRVAGNKLATVTVRSPQQSITVHCSINVSQVVTPSPTYTETPVPTYSVTPTPTYSVTPTPSPVESESPSPSPTSTETSSPSPSPTSTETSSPSPSPISTESPSPSPSPTYTESPSPSSSPSGSPISFKINKKALLLDAFKELIRLD